MIWAFIFQLVAAFFFVGVLLRDRKNRAIVTFRKRFWYSLLLWVGSDFLIRLCLRGEYQILLFSSISGLSEVFANVGQVIKTNGFYAILVYLIGGPSFLWARLPNFLIFWIWFSANRKIKISTTVFYVLWCAISIWLCVAFPDREQRAAETEAMMRGEELARVLKKKNIFFASRAHIHMTGRRAAVEYKILNPIKTAPSASLYSSIVLHYCSDGDTDGFRVFIEDEYKKFALIFIDDIQIDGDKYHSIGDGYEVWYIGEDELIAELSKIKYENLWEKFKISPDELLQ